MILLRKALAALLALALGSPASAGQNSRPAVPPTGTPAVPVAGMDLRIGVTGAEAGALTPQPVQLGPGLDLPASAALPAAGTPAAALPARTETAAGAAVRAETAGVGQDPGAASVPAVGPLEVVASVQPAGAEPEDKPDVAAGAAAAKAVVKDLKPGDPGWVAPTRPAGAPTSIAEMRLEPEAGRTYHPSPEDWSDEVIYSLVVDRFERGPGFRTQGDPEDPHSRHGGNLKGLLARLDYIQPLATTIVITPLHMNASNPSIGYHAYHGYWAIDLGAVEPFIGTLEDAKAAVAAAHAKGMRVLIDPAINHMGPVFVYKDKPEWAGMEGAPKEIGQWQYDVYPVELRDPAHYERRGPIADWNAPDQRLHGDFPPDLRKLRTDRPETQDVIIHTILWWIKELDADGLRIDSHDHIHRSFWDRFFPALRAYTARLGKANFFVPGELFHGDPKKVSDEVGPGKLDGAYNYPDYFWAKKALHGQESTHALAWSFYQIAKAFGSAAKRLIRFLDNQDKPRFLKPSEPLSVLQVALAYVFFSIGIPFIQYGTEQALRDMGMEDLGFGTEREDLWKTGFAQDGPMYRYIAELNRIRKLYPALRRGEQFVRLVDPETPEGQPYNGVYAFSRIHQGQEVLVVMNTSEEPRSAEMWVDAEITPAGTQLVDVMGPGGFIKSWGPGGRGTGAKVSVDIPGRSVRVYVASSRLERTELKRLFQLHAEEVFHGTPGMTEVRISEGTSASSPYYNIHVSFDSREALKAAESADLPRRLKGIENQSYRVILLPSDDLVRREKEEFAALVQRTFAGTPGMASAQVDAGTSGSDPYYLIRLRFDTREALKAAASAGLPRQMTDPSGQSYRVVLGQSDAMMRREKAEFAALVQRTFAGTPGMVSAEIDAGTSGSTPYHLIRLRFDGPAALRAAEGAGLPSRLTDANGQRYRVILQENR